MPNRSKKASAPGPLTPSGKLDLAPTLDRLASARQRTLTFARDTELPIKQYTADHPGFGTLNAYQWLIFLALHHQRHNQQIVEVMNGPGFPAG